MAQEPLSIVFFGSPPLAEAVLDELEAAGYLPALVITQPDHFDSRKKKYVPAPVKVWAEERGIEVLQPERLKDSEDYDLLMNSEWDLFVVASYGKILPKELVEKPRYGSLNVHPSLLPKLRGASPVRTSILNNEPGSLGVTLIKMDEEMDHGPIVAQASVQIGGPARLDSRSGGWPPAATVLEALLAEEGGKLLAETLPHWIAGDITPEEQNHDQATLTKKIAKEDGEIAMDGALPCTTGECGWQNFLKIRAFDGWPGTYFFYPERNRGVRVKITDAEFENRELKITRVIPEGKREMDYDDFLRGIRAF